MNELLLLLMIHDITRPVQSVNGVIWNKRNENFVPIFSDPTFAAMNQERLSQSRREETHNFQGKIVKLSYFESINMIVTSDESSGQVTGFLGDTWNTLSEFLNFTLKPMRNEERGIGDYDENGTYTSGLLRIMQLNQTDVVAKVYTNLERLSVVRYTMPFWLTRYRLYIRREVTHLPTWMLKLFSRKVWYAILMTYLLLTFCSYVSHKIGMRITGQRSNTNLNDHFIYNLGMICGQSHLPPSLSKSSRIVNLWLGLFSCLVRTAFSALLIGFMTQTTVIPPFYNLDSLVDNTSYHVVALNGSFSYSTFQKCIQPACIKMFKKKRYFVANSLREMYEKACFSSKPYAISYNEHTKSSLGLFVCPLYPVGKSWANVWITSGISKNFMYKRSIDMGILKLHEVGSINMLKNRWIKSKNEEEETNMIKPIVMEQVYLILLIFGGGLLVAFMILVFESVTFYCNNRQYIIG